MKCFPVAMRLRKKSKCTQVFFLLFGILCGTCVSILLPYFFIEQKCDISSPVTPSVSYDSGRELLFVGVMTAAKYVSTRVKAISETWARDIPGRVVFFTSESSPIIPGLPIVRLQGVDDSYPPQKKSFAMLKYMSVKFGSQFEFFMRADDDVFVRSDKLFLFLRSLNSSRHEFVGQAGQGIAEEVGRLSLGGDENFCMGGPGVIMSHATLAVVAPHVDECLMEMRSGHEDVEVGRCVRKFAQVQCTWAYEMQSIFYHNGSGVNAFMGSLKETEIKKSITLHPVKNATNMYRIHEFFKGLSIREMEKNLISVMRDLKKVENEYGFTVANLDDPENGIFVQHLGADVVLQKVRPSHEDDIQEWQWNHRGTQYSSSHESGKQRLSVPHKEAQQDVVLNLMETMNSGSQNHGRVIDFKEILYCYFRIESSFGLQFILDLLLMYKKYKGRKMTVPVRRHVYVQVPFGGLYVQEKKIEALMQEKELGSRKEAKEDLKSSVSNPRYQGHQDAIKEEPQKINFILPLFGRFNSFQRFISNYKRLCLEGEEVGLTRLLVVVFSSDDEENVDALVTSLGLGFPGTEIGVLKANSSVFSRAVALDLGAKLFEPDDLLLFMDVDLTFNADFLQRVRLHTVKGKQVYHPIVFSEFNPKKFNESIDNKLNQMQISEESGYWRWFGFGITSMYQKDFISIGGSDTSIYGWGKEDVDVYRKVIAGQLTSFRCADPSLMHIYHPIECSSAVLDPTQLSMCHGTRLNTFASTTSLAKLFRSKFINGN